ncbi:MAG: hypothetical protein ABF629_13900 [Sporolactobacillus sp.]
MTDRTRLFFDEIEGMLQGGYLTKAEASRLRTVYTRYIAHINEAPKVPPAQPKKLLSEKPKPLDARKSKAAHVPKQPKKKLTREQLHEKNLTLVLILGVSFLLLGGFILATTNWGTMNAWVKMLAILSVSIVFSVMSFIARKLHIRQTAFAFTTLSALFLPIVLVCASYYQLFGTYFALHGNGASLLGFVSSLLFVLLYHWIARRFASRLFEGLSLLFSYAALCFGTYFMTHQVTAWQVLINLFSLIWLAAPYFLQRVRQSRFFHYTLKYDQLFTQVLVAANALLALAFWRPATVYAIVTLLVSCAFLWCVYKGLSKGYHAGYLFFCALTFQQTILFTHNYSLSIILWTVLLIFYTGLSEFGIQRFADPLWARVYQHLSAAACCLFCIMIPFITYFKIAIEPNSMSYFLSPLCLAVIFGILVYLTWRHPKTWFPYAALFAAYTLVFDACIIFKSSFATELRCVMILSIVLYTGLFLYKRTARFMSSYQSAIPIVTASFMLLSLIASYAIFDKWEWLTWALIVWALMLLTSLLRTDLSAKIAGHTQSAVFGLVLLILFPEHWHYDIQLVSASTVLLAAHLLARTYNRAYRMTILYTSGVYYLLSLLFMFNEIASGPTVSGLVILIYGVLISAVLLMRNPNDLWAALHGLLAGAALFYPVWLLASHGVQVTGLVLYLEAAALTAVAACYLLNQKKLTIAGPIYYWLTHILMLFGVLLTWNSFFEAPAFPVVSLLAAGGYMFYCFKTKNATARLISFCCSAILVLGLFENIQVFWSMTGISFWQCVSVTAVILYLFYIKANSSWKRTAFYPTLVFLGLAVPTAFLDPFYWMIIPLGGFVWFAWHAVKIVERYVFSNIVLLLIFLWGSRLQDLLPITQDAVYSLALTTLVATLCWVFSKESWRCVLHPTVFCLLAFTALVAVRTTWDLSGVIITLIGICASLGLLVFLYVYRLQSLSIVPMMLLSLLIWLNLVHAPFAIKTVSFLSASLVLLAISLWQRKPFIEKKHFSLNYELITAFAYLFVFYGYMAAHTLYFGKLTAACLMAVYGGLTAYRSVHLLERKIWMNGALIALLWPAAIILQKSPLFPFMNHVLLAALFLIIVSLSCRKLWSTSLYALRIEWIAVAVIYLRLMLLALTIGETGALLTFAIVALVGTSIGFLLKYKSYFFTSIVALIISLLYNRRHMWIELPWWFYLVIGGFVLIAIASIAEWTRQDKLRRAKLNLPPRESMMQKIKHYLNAWH